VSRKKKAKHQYRSKFEERLGDGLDKAGVSFGYETETYLITVKVPGSHCAKCGSKEVERDTTYTPDFFFPRYVVESKGRFTARDRKRVLALVSQGDWTQHTFAMLFMRDNTLSKSSKTRYSDWCKEHCIPYAIGAFPKEWLQ
jgi:hypothetical protein